MAVDNLIVRSVSNAWADNVTRRAATPGRKVLAGAATPTRDQLVRTGAQVAGQSVAAPTVSKTVADAISKAFGLALPADFKALDAETLNGYLRTLDNSYDKADAVDALGIAIASGERNGAALAQLAESRLYTQRGVGPLDLARLKRTGLSVEQQTQLRLFADAHATSQGGKMLTVAARGLEGPDLAQAQRLVALSVAKDAGLVLPKGGVDNQVVLSIARDLGTEDPRDAAVMVQVANEAFRRGTTDYYAIHAATTTRLLSDLGADGSLLKALDTPDAALKAALPNLDVEVARAEQLRLLRDRLRVLPAAERADAITLLRGAKTDLIGFDAVLDARFEQRLTSLLGDNAALKDALVEDMAVQQRGNLLSDLASLPQDVREKVFTGLTGTPTEMAATATSRLTQLSEDRFGVHVHRAAGQSPFPGQGADSQILDWNVQAATELYLGLEHVTAGKPLASVTGTTYFHLTNVEAKPTAQALAAEQALQTLYRPGASRYRADQSGLMGKEYRGMGYRTTRNDQEFVALYDTALKLDNTNRVAGVSRGVGTIVHETGHVVQLGGPGEQKAIREWSLLSQWREPDGTVADGVFQVKGSTEGYYKDPEVQLGNRRLVVSQYGATDPVEDWAEFSRVFILDPVTALKVSPEKFLYMNATYEGHYGADRIAELANATGLGPQGLERARVNLAGILKAA